MFKSYLVSSLSVLLFLSATATAQADDLKPRVIILTDISPATHEPDDMESMIRLMAYADQFEIEGLVASTGWSLDGSKGEPWLPLIHDVINAYEKDLPNLRKRSNQQGHLPEESGQKIGYWPSAKYLHARTVMGSKKRGYSFIGKDNDSPGSELIVKAADKKDDRPIYVCVWGGANTLAQAIWRVRADRTAEQLTQFLRKIRVFTITDQDRGQGMSPYESSSHFWMRKEFEKALLFIWDESAWGFQNRTGRSNWDKYAAQIQKHGNLGAMYPKYRYGVEGDTPSFLYVMPNGLNDPENPGFGSWGGTFAFGTSSDKQTKAYVNQKGSPASTASRKYEEHFYPAIFNDFAARMKWAKDGAGNRNPQIVINGDGSLARINLTSVAGTSVTLDASASKDPDGDKLSFSWWVLTEAGTYPMAPSITGSDSSRATINVPTDAAGKTFHVICEVTDNGTPSLTSYRRILFAPTNAAKKK
jgi:hypothetical protein